MFQRGELKSLVENLEVQTGGNILKRDLLLKEEITTALEKGELKIKDFDFEQMAVELATNGVPLKEYCDRHGVGGVAEAMGASAFPIMTKTVVGFFVIQSYEVAMGKTDKLVTEEDSRSTSRDTIPGHTAAGGFENRPEGTRYEDKGIGEKKVSIRTDDFGEMFSFTKEALYEDRMGKLPKWANEAGRKGGLLRAKTIIQTLELQPRTALGETASTLECHVANGTIITQANHYKDTHAAVTGLDGQVNDNLDITDSGGTLTTNGINACYKLFGDFLDEKSDEIVVAPTALVVPVKLAFTAWQLLGSEGQFDTANRAQGGAFWRDLLQDGVITSPFLAQDYFYYIGEFQRQLTWLWTFRPDTEMASASASEAFTNNIIWRVKHSWHGGCGHTDYKYIIKAGSA